MTAETAGLLEILNRFNRCRVAVIGDLMLDCYVWGQVERISPEAPVPIVQVKKSTSCLGGAANVMRNIVTLGGRVDAFGVVGDDANGRHIRTMLAEYGISREGVFCDGQRPSIQKERVMAGSQQLLRIDYEDPTPIDFALRSRLVAAVEELLRTGAINALVIEDYAKGLFSETMAQKLVDLANAAGALVTMDPNPRNPMRLSGLTAMKPNRSEAFAMAGVEWTPPAGNPEDDRALKKVAAILRRKWDVKYLLISLAAQGMALFDDRGGFTVIPTRAREVYDVSGAGDTVVAAATLALAAGGDARSAAELANHAAGIVVRQLGTATVSAEELRQSILRED